MQLYHKIRAFKFQCFVELIGKQRFQLLWFSFAIFFPLIAKNQGMDKQGHGLAFNLVSVQFWKMPSELPRPRAQLSEVSPEGEGGAVVEGRHSLARTRSVLCKHRTSHIVSAPACLLTESVTVLAGEKKSPNVRMISQ